LKGKIFWLSASGMIIINIFLTNHLYTTLLQYQAGSQAGRFIYSHSIPANDVVIYKMDDPLNSIQFYAQGSITSIETFPQMKNRNYMLTMDPGLKSLKENGYQYDVVQSGESFKVSELTGPFLNPKTRKAEVKNYYLIKLKRP